MAYKSQVNNQNCFPKQKQSSLSIEPLPFRSNIIQNRATATRDNHSHRWAEKFHSRIDCAPARKGCGSSFIEKEREFSTDLHSLLLRHASFFWTWMRSRYIQHFKAFSGDDRYSRTLLNPLWIDGTFKWLKIYLIRLIIKVDFNFPLYFLYSNAFRRYSEKIEAKDFIKWHFFYINYLHKCTFSLIQNITWKIW